MERLLGMLGVLAVAYAAYALSFKKWDYTSEAKRLERRNVLKAKGMSDTFYFIHARTLFVLNALSGGLFVFYWLYRQWQAVLYGFKRQDGTKLAGSALLRTVGGFGTFFQLNAIICRTCEYMHHKAPLAPWAWGFLWLGGLASALAAPGWAGKLAGYLFFCAAPAALQNRLNALPKTAIPGTPKTPEIIAAAGALVLALCLVALGRIVL